MSLKDLEAFAGQAAQAPAVNASASPASAAMSSGMADFLRQNGIDPSGAAGQPAEQQRTWGEAASDMGAKLGQGVVQGLDAASGLVNLATFGGLRKAQKALDLDPDAGSFITNDIERNHLSEKQQAGDQAVNDAKGVGGTLKALWDHPSTAIAGGVMESIPTMVMPGGMARAAMGGIVKQAVKEALLKGATKEAAELAGQEALKSTASAVKIAWASHAGEGLETAGGIAQQALQNDDGDASKMYWGVPAGFFTAVIGRLAGKVPGFGDAEAAFFAGGANKALRGTGNKAVQIAKGAIEEGALQELPQSMQEQAFTNLATGKSVGDGAVEAGVQGLVVGGAMGGGHATLTGGHEAAPAPTPAPTPGQQQQGPTPAQARAANAFADVSGDPNIAQGQHQEQGFLAAILANMDDDHRATAIDHLSGGDNDLKAKIEGAVADPAMVQAGHDTFSNNVDAAEYVNALSHEIRHGAGLLSDTAQNGIQAPTSETVEQTVQQALQSGLQEHLSDQAQQQASDQAQGINSAGFVAEPLQQEQAQVEAAKTGRIKAAVVGLESLPHLDVNGLQTYIAIGPDGKRAAVLTSDPQLGQQAVTRAADVGLKQAMGEVKGYTDPTLTDHPASGAVVVQQHDDNGHVIHEELIKPEDIPAMQRVPGATISVKPVHQALQERQQNRDPNDPRFQRNDQTSGIGDQMFGKEQPAAPAPQLPKGAKVTGNIKSLAASINSQLGLAADDENAIDPGSVGEVDVRGDHRLTKLTRAVKQAFGVNLVVMAPRDADGAIKRNNGKVFNTVHGVAIGNNLFMSTHAVTGKGAALNTMGHELAHIFKTLHPALYAKLEFTVVARIQRARLLQFKQQLAEAVQREGGKVDAEALAKEMRDEMVAEAVGEMTQDQSFWKELFGRIGDEQQSKSLYDKVLELLGKWAKAFTRQGWIEGTRDMQTVRKAITEAYLEWSRREANGRAAVAQQAGEQAKQAEVAKQAAERDATREASHAQALAEGMDPKWANALYGKHADERAESKAFSEASGTIPTLSEVARHSPASAESAVDRAKADVKTAAEKMNEWTEARRLEQAARTRAKDLADAKAAEARVADAKAKTAAGAERVAEWTKNGKRAEVKAEPAPAATPAKTEITVASKKVSNTEGFPVTNVTLSNGKKFSVVKLNSSESMGLPGWHLEDGADSSVQSSYLADTQKAAIEEMIRRESDKAAPTPAAQPAKRDTTSKAEVRERVPGAQVVKLVSSIGGLDPSWLSEFSYHQETGRKDKNGKPVIRWRNPLIKGVGTLFRKGGTQDLGVLAELLESHGYLTPGTDAHAAGQEAQEIIRAAIRRDEVKTVHEQLAEHGAAQEAEREHYLHMAPQLAENAEADRVAMMGDYGIEPEDMDVLDDSDTDWFSGQSLKEVNYELAQAAEEANHARALESAAEAGRDASEGEGSTAEAGAPAPQPGSDGRVKFQRAPAVDSPAFKAWFDGSKITNEDGSPKVMYHGTARDITTFRPQQAGAIFLTDNPKFAQSFASLSENWVANNLFESLTPTQRDDAFKAAAQRIRREYLKDPAIRKDMLERLERSKTEGREPVGEALDYFREFAKQHLDAAQNIMPLYVAAKSPFDYGDHAQVTALVDQIFKDSPTKAQGDGQPALVENGKPTLYTKGVLEYGLGEGNWSTIEQPFVQAAMKALGHDSFYVEEGGEKNLAVFNPAQVKSVTGNRGTYDGSNPDIRFQRLRETTAIKGQDGAPMRVFHGHAKGLTVSQLDTAHAGKTTGNPSAHLGLWFTSNPEEAARYGETVSNTFLDIRRPKRLRIEAFPDFESPAAATRYRDQLQRQGFDGIAIDARHLGGPQNFVAFNNKQVVEFDDLPEGEASELSPEEAAAMGFHFQRAEGEKPVYTHEVYDPKSGKAMGRYQTIKAARRGRDRFDNQYGSYHYRIREIARDGHEPRPVYFQRTPGDNLHTHSVERLDQMIAQQSQQFADGKMSHDEHWERTMALQAARYDAKKREDAAATPTRAEVFPGFTEIPTGTRVKANWGTRIKERMGTVTGNKMLRIGRELYSFPQVKFDAAESGERDLFHGEPKQLGYGDVKEVYAPRPVSFQRNATHLSSVDEVEQFLKDGQLPYQLNDAIARGNVGEAIRLAKTPGQVKGALRRFADTVIEHVADHLIPVQRWVESLPLSENHKQRLLGALRLSNGMRAQMEEEVQHKFAEPLFKAIAKAARSSSLTTDQIKKIAGYWMSASYATKANSLLVAKDRAALADAQASGNAAAIAIAQVNLTNRLADVNRAANVSGPYKRGVAGGLSNARAQALVKLAEAKVDPAQLKEIAQHVYGMMAWKKALDLKSGKVSQTMVNSWANHPDYVPLTGDPRYNPDTDDVFSQGGNQLNQTADQAMNGRTDSVADDAIDAAFQASVKSVNFAAMQGFKAELNKTYMAAAAAGQDVGLHRAPVTGIVRNSDDVVIYRHTQRNAKGHEFTEAHAFSFADPHLMDALKKNTIENVARWAKWVSVPTRWYARFVTQFMPLFAPVNFVRDTWERNEMMRTRALVDANGKKVNVSKAANYSIGDSLNPAVWKAAILKAMGSAVMTPERGELEQLIRLGGMSSHSTALARSASAIEAQARSAGGTMKKVFDGFHHLVHSYNMAFEMVPSLTAFRALKAQGMTPEDAAAAVLDMMDFSKKGASMANARALYTFAQPAATSGYNLARYLSTRTGQVRFVAQLVVATALYAMLKADWDDDKDKDLGNKLDNLSNYTVERSIPVRIGGTLLKIPVGFGAPQLAWVLGATLSRWQAGRYTTGDAAGEAAKAWIKAVAPVQPSDVEIGTHPVNWFLQSISPMLLKPLVNIGLDSTAMGGQLTPPYKDPKKLLSEQAKRSTSPVYTQIAKELHDLTGVDMYPDHVKALVDGYVVGPAHLAVQAGIDNPAREARGEPAQLTALSQIVDTVNDRQILTSVYYRVRGDLEQSYREYESAKATHSLAQLPPQVADQHRAFERFQASEKALSSQRSQAYKLMPKDGGAAVQRVEDRSDDAHRRVLQSYFASIKKS